MFIVNEWAKLKGWFRILFFVIIIFFAIDIFFFSQYVSFYNEGRLDPPSGMNIIRIFFFYDDGPGIFGVGITILLILFMIAMYPNRLIEKRTRTSTKQLADKSETFRNLITRTKTIEIDRLSSILEMDEITLLQWMITLPQHFGFTINGNTIEFDNEMITDNIDDLINEFMKMEDKSYGKIE